MHAYPLHSIRSLAVAGVLLCALALTCAALSFAEGGTDDARESDGFTIVDEEGTAWSLPHARVDLFGSEGSLAPGASGTYRFVMANDCARPMTCALSLTAEGAPTPGQATVPLDFEWRVDEQRANGEPTGAASAMWRSSDEPIEMLVAEKGSVSCVLEWRWPFEHGDSQNTTDTADTKVAEGASPTLTLTLEAQAEEVIPPEESAPPEEVVLSEEVPASDPLALLYPGTGDRGAFVLGTLATFALLATGLMVAGRRMRGRWGISRQQREGGPRTSPHREERRHKHGK